ncbi:clasp N terminal-domain-containing protein [Dichotomocladium elegans]|nr:clasp N terminal-domain-containing protein [Dichotomocladium elegans]
MTSKDKGDFDINPVQLHSVKELESEFSAFSNIFRDKESEQNWEARDKAVTRLRGILRGDAYEKFHDALMLHFRQMVDGIIKAMESLRTSLALNALLLVSEIGYYLGRSIDAYVYERLTNSLLKCATTSKKVIATQTLKTTSTFLRYANFHHKIVVMLSYMMNEKNSQAREYTVAYIKIILQTHAPRDHVRAQLDRSGATDLIVKILSKGVNDATPSVRESCREAFWIFMEYWRDRGDSLLRTLPPAVRKALEKSKMSVPPKSRNIHSPTNSSSSLHTSSSLGSHRNVSDIHEAISPSSSSASNGSSGSNDQHHYPHEIPKTITRNITPRATSPSIRSTSPHLLRSTYGSPPPGPSNLHSSYMAPRSPPPPPPPSIPATRKTRVPGLTRKKSTIGSSSKRKLSLLTMLTHDDLTMRSDGLHMLARKLMSHPYSPIPDLKAIHIDSTSGAMDGDKIKEIVWGMFLEENNIRLYEMLSSWEGVAGLLLKLVPFDEYLPRLILDATPDPAALKTDDDITKVEFAKQALKRAKIFLKRYDPELPERLVMGMVESGGFGGPGGSGSLPSTRKTMTPGKKDPMRNPATRRKLMAGFLEWMDELVAPILGLEADNGSDELDSSAREWIGEEGQENTASVWFESDVHVRECIEKFLPLVPTSSPGSIVHRPLVSFICHLRLVNQKLFEIVAATYDSGTVNKISRILGIHIRPVTDYVYQAPDSDQQNSTNDYDGNDETMQGSFEDSSPCKEVIPGLTENEDLIRHGSDDKNNFDSPNLIDNTRQHYLPITPQSPEHPFTTEAPAETSPSRSPVYSTRPLPNAAINESTLATDQEHSSLDYSSLPPTEESIEPTLQGSPLPPTIHEHAAFDPYVTSRPVATAAASAAVSHYLTVNSPDRDDAQTADDITLPIAEPYKHDSSTHSIRAENSSVLATDISLDVNGPLDRQLLEEPESLHYHHRGPSPSPAAMSYAGPMLEPLSSGPRFRRADAGLVSGVTSPPQPPSSMRQAPVRPTISTETKQVQQQQPKRTFGPISHVPYFSPREVIDALPVFTHNTRTETTTARVGKDKTMMLYALVDKLVSGPADNATFRKLVRLAREASIIQPWDQGGSNEAYSELWAGSENNGGNFVELIQAMYLYLVTDKPAAITLAALELVRQLLVTQVGLFKYYERKVDDHGMSIEAHLVEHLLEVRALEDASISTSAEDTLDMLFSILDPQNAFDVMIAYLVHRLVLAPPTEDQRNTSRYHPVGSAFTYLGKCVKEVGDAFFVDEWLTQGGAIVFIRGMGHSMIHVRKSCVEAIVEFHSVLGDDIYKFLDDLRGDQLNLVRHYISRTIKQRSSHSSFSSTPTQF